MIDLHCHILPWVDDGAANAEIACAMAEHALSSGVDTVVATPHCNLYGARGNYRGRRFDVCIGLFRALLRQHGIRLNVLPGAELLAHPSNLRELLDRQRIVTLNHTRYLLVEFDFETPGSRITDMLEGIARRRLIPVVAHPERYFAVQEMPELAACWFHSGCLLQLNKGSLLGRLGAASERTAVELLQRGLADVVASDAHDISRRPAGFVTLLPVLRRLCPQEYIDLLLTENPRLILRGQKVR